MKKVNLIFIILIFIIFIIGVYIFLNNQNENPEVCFKENCFFVELALTEGEKTKGLMFRGFLGEDKGMLFIYEKEGIYSFWMKNTLIPLDIIWINSDKKVVHIESNVKPCNEECKSLYPSENAQFVLEINGGLAERLNIKLGDEIKFHKI